MVKEKKRMTDEFNRQTEIARDKFAIEKQKACEEEREFARNRYQKQFERDEMEVIYCARCLTQSFNNKSES